MEVGPREEPLLWFDAVDAGEPGKDRTTLFLALDSGVEEFDACRLRFVCRRDAAAAKI